MPVDPILVRNTAAWLRKAQQGSHGTLYYGARFTMVQNLNSEIEKASLLTMLDQLGLTLGELLKGKE
jgi:hypothetical protein